MSPSSASSQAPEARLLVVEDEPNIRELLATSLKFNGFEVEVAATADQFPMPPVARPIVSGLARPGEPPVTS